MIRRGRAIGRGTALSNMVMFQMPHSLIKSVQRGTITISGTTSNTATITAVSLNNSIITYLYHSTSSTAAAGREADARVELTDNVTVTAVKGFATGDLVASYEVIEFWPGIIRSVQRGTVTVANGATSNTATITSVNTIKSFIMWLGRSTTSTSSSGSVNWLRLDLTDATTVTATRNSSTDAFVVGYQVVEFW